MDALIAIVRFFFWAQAQNAMVAGVLATVAAVVADALVSGVVWLAFKAAGSIAGAVGAAFRRQARAQAPRRMTAAEQAALASGQVKPVSDRDMAELRAAAQALADLQNNRLQAVSPAQQRAAQERYARALKRVQR